MAEIVQMPKMSDTMEEGVIAAWHKKVGDKVEEGELMAEIETDKATMEYESFHEGTILYLGAEEGEAVEVNGVLAIVGEEGEDYKPLLEEAKSSGDEKSDDKEEASSDDSSGGNEEEIDTSDVNADIVIMPKMSDTMEEGVLAAWHKKVGDKVESGEVMAEIETDKATMEYESFHDGTVLYLGAKEGEAIPVNGVLAIVGEEGADYEKLLKAQEQKEKGGGKKEKPAEEKKEKPEAKKEEKKTANKTPEPKADTGDEDGRIKASPLAKKLAKEKGYKLADIPGSGPNGRIIKDDVENFTPQQAPAGEAKAEEGKQVVLPTVVGEESHEEVKISQMRKTIARRLAESKFTAPHFYLTMEINMDKAMEARKSMNEVAPVKISFNDMVIKAVAAAIRKHPNVNVSWKEDVIRKNHHIHIGVAVAVDEGLLVPVVRFADNKSLSHLSQEVKELAGKAKSKKIQPADMEGSTFTISNLGMFGIEEFTAIVNPPDSCIMAVGGIKQTPVVKNGEVVPGNVMKVTLSCDHRTVDGAVGSAFLKTFKELMEDPVRILI